MFHLYKVCRFSVWQSWLRRVRGQIVCVYWMLSGPASVYFFLCRIWFNINLILPNSNPCRQVVLGETHWTSILSTPVLIHRCLSVDPKRYWEWPNMPRRRHEKSWIRTFEQFFPPPNHSCLFPKGLKWVGQVHSSFNFWIHNVYL